MIRKVEFGRREMASAIAALTVATDRMGSRISRSSDWSCRSAVGLRRSMPERPRARSLRSPRSAQPAACLASRSKWSSSTTSPALLGADGAVDVIGKSARRSSFRAISISARPVPMWRAERRGGFLRRIRSRKFGVQGVGPARLFEDLPMPARRKARCWPSGVRAEGLENRLRAPRHRLHQVAVRQLRHAMDLSLAGQGWAARPGYVSQ